MRFLYQFLILVLFILPVFGLVGCSGKKSEANSGPETTLENVLTAEELYSQAQDAMGNKLYVTAARLFDSVEQKHPYSEYATQAKLMTAYAYYKALKYDQAIIALDRFIELHPGHPDIAYAYYLRAISLYEQIIDVGRDQEITEIAMDSLKDVIKRFENTEYARDAKLKLDLTLDHLAGKEMEIGRYYLKRKHYQASLNRFKTVVDQYQTTTHTPEALHRMVEAYLALGIRNEAQNIAAVLGHNYPGSKWYQASYALLKGGDLPDFRQKPKTTLDRLKNKLF